MIFSSTGICFFLLMFINLIDVDASSFCQHIQHLRLFKQHNDEYAKQVTNSLATLPFNHILDDQEHFKKLFMTRVIGT